MTKLAGRGVSKIEPHENHDILWGWMALQKVDAEERIVEGFASTEELDGQPGIFQGQYYQGDVVTAKAIADALPDYMEWANLREMHDLTAVGTVLKAELIDGDIDVDGRMYRNPLHIVAKVIDDEAWNKVKEGVYKGFSIGGKVVKALLDKISGKTVRKVVKLLLHEISLVDRPANPGARILLWKSFSLDEQTQRIRDAWYGRFQTGVPQPTSTNAWVVEVLNDQVVVQTDEGLYAYPFTAEESGEIVFNQAPVKVKREYVAESIAAGLPAAIDESTNQSGSSPERGEEVTKSQEKKIQKAADPSKTLSMLQALRDETELNGDLEGASLFSQAIALILQASEGSQGEPEPEPESTEEPEVGEELPETDDEELQLAAGKGALKKTGRIFSGPNASAMHNVIQALAKMLAGAGDETANKVLGCYTPPEERPADGDDAAKANVTDDLQKAFQPALDGLQKSLQEFSQRLENLERQPAPGGPILRPVEKIIAGQGPSQSSDDGQTQISVADLRKLAALEPDPIKKAEFARQLWVAEHETVKK